MANTLPPISTMPVPTVEIWEPFSADPKLGNWVYQDWLWCHELSLVVQPSQQGVSRAKLEWNYGEIARNEEAFKAIAELVLTRKWVRITCPSDTGDPVRFVGLVVATKDNDYSFSTAQGVGSFSSAFSSAFSGGKTGGGGGGGGAFSSAFSSAFDGGAGGGGEQEIPQVPFSVFRGDTEFEVVGPEWLLTREQISRSAIYDDYETVNGEWYKTVERALSFNRIRGRHRAESEKLEANKKVGELRFGTRLSEAEIWTGEDIVKYLWQYHIPRSLFPPNVWQINGESNLSWVKPTLVTEARSVYEVMNELVSGRRALSWRIRYEADTTDEQTLQTKFGLLHVEFRTTTARPISLPSGEKLPSNVEQVQLFPAGHIEGGSVVILDTQQQYEQIIVQGARMGVVRTYAFGGGEGGYGPPGSGSIGWVFGWTFVEEQLYGLAMSQKPGYPTDPREQEKVNDRMRVNEFAHVFTRFEMDRDIDDLIPIPETTPVEYFQTYYPGLRFERRLPLLQGWDYSGSEPQPGEIDQPDYVDMFAVYDLSTDEYIYTTDLGKVTNDDEEDAYGWSARIRPLDAIWGFELVPNVVQHVQSLGIEDTTEIRSSAKVPQVDVRKMLVTGYTYGDARVEAKFPEEPEEALNYHVSKLVIAMGDIAYLDWMPANTLVGLREDGKPVFSSGNMYVRDDREILQDMARMAWRFYGRSSREAREGPFASQQQAEDYAAAKRQSDNVIQATVSGPDDEGKWWVDVLYRDGELAASRVASRVMYKQIAGDILPGNVVTHINGIPSDCIASRIDYNFNDKSTTISTDYVQPDLKLFMRQKTRLR